MSISVLVADDHPIIRAGVVSMLRDTEMRVVAEAATGNQRHAERRANYS